MSELLIALRALPIIEKSIIGGVLAILAALAIWLGYHYSRTFGGFLGLSIVLLVVGASVGFYVARRGVQEIRSSNGLFD